MHVSVDSSKHFIYMVSHAVGLISLIGLDKFTLHFVATPTLVSLVDFSLVKNL